MLRSILFLLALGLSVLGRAQERTATVRLEDGRELVGRVVTVDLRHLQLAIGPEVITIATGDIKMCRFDEVGAPAKVENQAGTNVDGKVDGQGDGTVEKAPEPPAATASRRHLLEPAIDHDDPEAVPHDIRNRSTLRSRLEAFDEFYPWLCPAAPTQWWSLGLILFSGLSLIIHLSVRVAGAEAAQFSQSVGLAAFYLIIGFGQLALVPANDLSIFSMLIGNSALSLFALHALFGLPRGHAFVAFAVQIGFVAVGFGVLQLADSLLRSVGMP